MVKPKQSNTTGQLKVKSLTQAPTFLQIIESASHGI